MAKRRTSVSQFEDRPPAQGDTLSLSFLDVLSCGLGAAIYLFLLFSVMPHVGQVGAGQRSRASAEGTDAIAREVGARFENWDDIVKNAASVIHLRIVASQPNAINVDDRISFTGLPRSVVAKPQPTADGQGYEWFVRMHEGVRPPDRLIVCRIEDEAELADFACELTVTVSGVSRTFSPPLLPDSRSARELFRVQLSNAEFVTWSESDADEASPSNPQ